LDKKLKGTSTHGKFDLHYTRQLQDVGLPFLRTGTKWTGFISQPFPFVLHVTKIQNEQIEGEMTWETLDTTTKILGKYENQKIGFKEESYVRGDSVVIPVEYDGKLVGTKFEGTYKADGAAGKFDIDLQ